MNRQPPSKVDGQSVEAKRQESNNAKSEVVNGTLRLQQLQLL